MENKTTGWKIAEEHIVKWMLGLALTAIATAVVFYFNTNYVMAQNTRDIKAQQEDVKSIKRNISQIKTIPMLNEKEISSLKKDVMRIEKNLEEMRKSQEKMLELLYQIKSKQQN